MIQDVFFAFTAVAIWYEAAAVMNPDKIVEMMDRCSKAATVKQFEPSESLFSSLQALYKLWVIGMIWSSQGPFFLLIFGLSFIPKRVAWIVRLDAVVTLILLLSAVLLRYYFKVDLLTFLNR